MARIVKAIMWLALVALALVVIRQAMLNKSTPREFAWGDFAQKMQAGRILSLTVDAKNIGSGDYKADNRHAQKYTVVLPDDKRTYEADARKYVGANFRFQTISGLDTWGQSLITLLVIGLLLLGFWLFMMRQTQSSGNQAMSFGRSRASGSPETGPKLPSTMWRAWTR